MLIALEGIDGSGKSYHSERLAERLNGTRRVFPDRRNVTGNAINSHLLGWWSADWKVGPDEAEGYLAAPIDALVFQALQTVNRLEVLPALKADMVKGPVVLDRYTASGMVYGQAEGLDMGWLESIHISFPQPDLWLLLDVDLSTSKERRPDRRDRYEKNSGFIEKVTGLYRELWTAKRLEAVQGYKWITVDARGTKEETAALIDAAVAQAREARSAA